MDAPLQDDKDVNDNDRKLSALPDQTHETLL
jgi:hypothetical protein